MKDQLRQLVLDTLRDLHHEFHDVTDDTPFGPAGLDLESLVIAELGLRVEETYGVGFSDDDLERVASQTLGEFVAEMAGRIAARDGLAVR